MLLPTVHFHDLKQDLKSDAEASAPADIPARKIRPASARAPSPELGLARNPSCTLIKELIAIPERVHQGDFVLQLTEGRHASRSRRCATTW
ncbi:MAG: hypothetical protein MZW92_66125 [Comamonadaceae bacterium]|nr:hypothetical protein [Comamonadaceae bacterium]